MGSGLVPHQEAEEALRHQSRETALCIEQTNQIRIKNNWGVQLLDMVVMRSVSCLLFTPVGRLVYHHLVIFSVGSSYKTSHPSFSTSLGVHHIQEYFKKKRGGSECK